MAKWLVSCYGALFVWFGGRRFIALLALPLVAISGWTSSALGEGALLLKPPSWPASTAHGVAEVPDAPRAAPGAPPPWFLIVAEHVLRGWLSGADLVPCDRGGSIHIACRENGEGPVLLSEVASCRLAFVDREEVSATGELVLELPEGSGCDGSVARACMAAVVRSADLVASLARVENAGVISGGAKTARVKTAEVHRRSDSAGRWLVPCPLEREAAAQPR